MAIDRNNSRFDRINNVRRVVAGAAMFYPETRAKIGTRADKLWTELRVARKHLLLEQLQGGTQRART